MAIAGLPAFHFHLSMSLVSLASVRPFLSHLSNFSRFCSEYFSSFQRLGPTIRSIDQLAESLSLLEMPDSFMENALIEEFSDPLSVKLIEEFSLGRAKLFSYE